MAKLKSISVKVESPTPISASIRSIRSPSPFLSPDQSGDSRTLSSPFMANLAIGDRTAKKSPSHDLRPIQITDVFCPLPDSNTAATAVMTSSISTPPTSPPQKTSGSVVNVGGEMERIRRALKEDRLMRINDTEKRRPEYLKRMKRTLSEAEGSFSLELEGRISDRGATVGVMESPNKGRRLKLFQETSEESFEESLMAGGYGRYVCELSFTSFSTWANMIKQRTSDWVRQPQPLSLDATAIPGSSSNVVTVSENIEDESLNEKELKKRKRLAAFRSESSRGGTKLCAVELEGKGRVLIDIPAEDHTVLESPEASPSKKRTGNRRKKKGTESASAGKKILGFFGNVDDTLVKPNWPDSEFPWRLRSEERVELAKAEQEERLRWIERFLDRDSDDDEDDAKFVPKLDDQEVDKGEPIPKSKWNTVYENASERPAALKLGRGKMVPLLAYPGEDTRNHLTVRRTIFPSDPADARVALLSKKTVRTLSYRQQRRYRDGDDDEDEVVCICNGKDDGRELVQCDDCQTWYHLHCIGIKNIAELGREEDPWFCRGCITRCRSPSTEPENFIVREPTLVPTDSETHRHRSEDMPFYQPPLHDSPNWHSSRMPKTPTRVVHNSRPESNQSLSSWIDSDSSRPGPSTPRHYTQTVGVFTTPGPFDVYNLEESPFDPTSTPSRGIKFNAPFATPKSNVWPTRVNGLFQTPSRAGGRGLANKTFGGVGSLSAVLDESDLTSASSSYDHFGRLYDESPIRRNQSNSSMAIRRTIHSPSRPPTSGATLAFLQESPIMRSSLPPASHNHNLKL